MNKGLVHIYTGNGKGKTTTALGLVLRAYGCKKKIAIFQFLKNPKLYCGEEKTINKLKDKCEILRFNQIHPAFKENLNKSSLEEYIKGLKLRIKDDFEKTVKIIKRENYDMVVLDEIINVVSNGYLKEKRLIEFIKNKSTKLELILTGRNASKSLIKIADYVTEMKEIKHPYRKGIKARKGIEY